MMIIAYPWDCPPKCHTLQFPSTECSAEYHFVEIGTQQTIDEDIGDIEQTPYWRANTELSVMIAKRKHFLSPLSFSLSLSLISRTM